MRTIPEKENLLNEFKSDIKEKNGLSDSEKIIRTNFYDSFDSKNWIKNVK